MKLIIHSLEIKSVYEVVKSYTIRQNKRIINRYHCRHLGYIDAGEFHPSTYEATTELTDDDLMKCKHEFVDHI